MILAPRCASLGHPAILPLLLSYGGPWSRWLCLTEKKPPSAFFVALHMLLVRFMVLAARCAVAGGGKQLLPPLVHVFVASLPPHVSFSVFCRSTLPAPGAGQSCRGAACLSARRPLRRHAVARCPALSAARERARLRAGQRGTLYAGRTCLLPSGDLLGGVREWQTFLSSCSLPPLTKSAAGTPAAAARALERARVLLFLLSPLPSPVFAALSLSLLSAPMPHPTLKTAVP